MKKLILLAVMTVSVAGAGVLLGSDNSPKAKDARDCPPCPACGNEKIECCLEIGY